jgi:hypothetical protein
MSSPATVAAIASPTSATPPGRLKWPSNGARAQRMMSARPPRNTAAEIDFKRSPWASPPWSFVRQADLRLQPEKADFCNN